MKFSLSQLRAFVSVAETRSFSTSATRLHVTQPTLSATIRTLEGLVEAKLFDRDTRNVAMTPVGEEFLAIAKRVLDEVERAQHDLKHRSGAWTGALRGVAGAVRLRGPAAGDRGVPPPARTSNWKSMTCVPSARSTC